MSYDVRGVIPTSVGRTNLKQARSPLLKLSLIALFLWWYLTMPGFIMAHALLVRSIPEANTVLSQSPPTIEMWFSEPLEQNFSGVRLFNSAGEVVSTRAANLDPADPMHMTLTVDELEPGIYTVAWQTLSQADGHEWTGSFPITILNPDGSQPVGEASTIASQRRGTLPTPGEIAARWFVLLGGILFFGIPLFQVTSRSISRNSVAHHHNTIENRLRDIALSTVWIAILALILGSLLQILLQLPRLGGLEQLPELLFSTRTGTLTLIRLALALTGLFVMLELPQPWLLRSRAWPLSLLVGLCMIGVLFLLIIDLNNEVVLSLFTITLICLGMFITVWISGRATEKIEPGIWSTLLILAGMLLLSISLGSHASAVPGSFWAILGDYVHLLAAAVWVGGLVLLLLLIWQARSFKAVDIFRIISTYIRHFSRLAALSVFILIVTGLFNSFVQLPDLASLSDTAYGRVLLLKLFLMMLMLSAAFLNNRLVHGRPQQLQEAVGLKRLNRQVVLEAASGLVLILSVAVLVQTPSPASTRPAESRSAAGQIFNNVTQSEDLFVHTQVLPNQVGHNSFIVHLYHDDNSSIGEVQLVRILFNPLEAEIGQARADLEPVGGNIYRVEGAYVNQPGPWELAVYVRRRGMDDTLATVKLDVPRPADVVTHSNSWQSPIPGVSVEPIILGIAIILGTIYFIWDNAR